MSKPEAKVLNFPTRRPARVGDTLPAGETPQDLGDPLDMPDTHEPCITGPAHCMQCQHEWVQVAPSGTTWFLCPGCGAEKGLLKYPVLPDEPQWVCDCGNTLFSLTERGWLCPNCGVYCRF